MTDRSDTKYGEMIADHDWSKPDEEPTPQPRTTIKSHEIDVYHDDEPDPDDNYGRTRYTVQVNHDEDGPYVLYASGHHWKGNYWRDTTDWDWRDLPKPVRETVVAALPVDDPDALDCGTRMMDEGGESRWQKIHKPRMESYDGGGEMWAESHVKEAVEKLDGAIEALDDEEIASRFEAVKGEVQAVATDMRGGDGSDE
jgi:hypothetical protein